MPTLKRRTDFYTSPEGVDTKRLLESMVANDIYNTDPTYTANTLLYPDNIIPFIDKHMQYLLNHPTIDPRNYISNLRLMTRLR
jgi:hypothetical protein